MNAGDELAAKQQRIEQLRANLGVDALLLFRNENIAWASGGARSHIVLSSDAGVGLLAFDRNGGHLITNTIEAERLHQEEFRHGAWHVHSAPWYEDWLGQGIQSLGAGSIAADIPFEGSVLCDTQVAALRTPLLPVEMLRYQELGRDTGEALEAAARDVERGDSEFIIGARIAAELVRREMDPVVLLVAVDGRINTVRHPLPTSATLDSRAMLVACGRRGGLIASATRIVSVDHVPAELAARHEACARVDAAFIAATVDGATASEIFAAGAAAYAAEGYDGEWRHHHQGGATGYAGRDWFATPHGTQVVQSPQAFAWNPSIAGTKVEDTILLREGTIEILTATGNWPTVTVRAGDLTLERPAILRL